jgi:hypothetical protein
MGFVEFPITKLTVWYHGKEKRLWNIRNQKLLPRTKQREYSQRDVRLTIVYPSAVIVSNNPKSNLFVGA